jgi:hypothetical protein
MLASANKHSWRHRRVCVLSGEAKERQQAFLAPLPGGRGAIGIRYSLNTVVELSWFGEPLFKWVYPCSTLVYAE